jgi:CheY-like chemotaxis protein
MTLHVDDGLGCRDGRAATDERQGVAGAEPPSRGSSAVGSVGGQVMEEVHDTPKGAGTAVPTVLLVEDEDRLRLLGARMLEHLGMRSLTARDGIEALEVLRSHADEVSVVLLDLSMPRMDGDHAIEEIRKILPDARIVLMSGYSEIELISRFRERGVAGYLQKPFRYETLGEKLKAVLAQPAHDAG